MDKKEYLKRLGQIYALAIQKGWSGDELMKYTEMSFSFLYLPDNSKQQSKLK
jgi:type III secretory pathway component EscS